MPHNVLKLGESQIRRHEMLKWYHENWKGEEWSMFAQSNADSFKNKFKRPIAPEGSLLCENLVTVLKIMQGRELRNVLLFFHRGNVPQIDSDFKIVKVEYEPAEGNYIEFSRKAT